MFPLIVDWHRMTDVDACKNLVFSQRLLLVLEIASGVCSERDCFSIMLFGVSDAYVSSN